MYEACPFIHHVSLEPVSMAVAYSNKPIFAGLASGVYDGALELKMCVLTEGGYFNCYCGPKPEKNAGAQAAFLAKHLCI